MALCLGECGPPAFFLGLSVPRGSPIGDGLCLRGSRLLTLLLRLQCMCAAFLLVLHAGKCSLMLQSPQGLASKLGEEAMVAEQQDDDSTSSLLVKEALSTCSLHLTFVVSALVKKALSCTSGFLAGGLLLQSSRGLASEPGKEAAAAEPQEDDSSSRRLPWSPCQEGIVDVHPSNPCEEDVELRKRPPDGHEQCTRPPTD